MELLKKELENGLRIAISGRLDTSTAPQLEAMLRETLPGVTELTLDCTDMDYISSAGLRVLLQAQKTMNRQGKMTVTGVQEAVMEVFEITGFSGILTIA